MSGLTWSCLPGREGGPLRSATRSLGVVLVGWEGVGYNELGVVGGSAWVGWEVMGWMREGMWEGLG